MATIKNNGILATGLIGVIFLFATTVFLAGAVFTGVSAQEPEADRFREGEKLTYNISFDSFRDAAYAEVLVASKGSIEGKRAVELRGRIKSINLVSAAFYLFDRSRTVFASSETGLPLYIRDVSKRSGIPIETISSFLSEPATNLDLLTLFYRARENGGAGSFSVLENGRIYSFDFASTGGETVKTVSEEFETSVSSVTSAYFDENGISDVKVYFSNVPDRVPVKISVRTPKGTFTAVLASASILVATPTPETTGTPVPTPTPLPTIIPTPSPTPYVENQNLSSDLPFRLGETLLYEIKKGDGEVAKIKLTVDSRKLIDGDDSVLIIAAVTDPGNASLFSANDRAEVSVDPYTLVPRRFSIRFNASFADWSQEAIFNQNSGVVTFGRAEQTDVPIGTHSLLSFAYAIRSFNLRPSKDAKNPVNDTRVAVFANDRAYILTLRPGENEKIEIAGTVRTAQLISIITGDPNVDRLSPRLWLSADRTRVPLRILIGDYQANLIP